jgi:two-component system, LytTR family, response regulator
MLLNCAIIDDEPLAAELLTSYADKTPFLRVIGSYNSAVTAMKDIRDNHVDVVFLDIQMPELSGIEFAKILPKDTKVIFTTAFNQYAVDSYKVDAIDYLLKPITYEDFLSASNKVLEWFSIIRKQNIYKEDRFMFVKSEYKLVQIELNDILFIEGMKDYIKIYTSSNDKPIMSLMNLKKIEDYLPSPEFMRIHRSYIVNMKKIKLIDRCRIVFGENYIPISESYKDVVQDYIDKHTLM